MINFHGNSLRSEKLLFDGLLLSIAYKISAKKVQKSYLSWYERVILTLKKSNFLLKKWHEEFENFNTSSGESVNLYFYGLLSSKVFNVWAKKMQRSCIVKNDFRFQKRHKEFDEQVVESKVDKSSVYNILAESMYFWSKVAHQIWTFWTFHCLSEVLQSLMWFLKQGVSFCVSFAPFCNVLEKTKV